ncbi:MAG: hypothetical protein J6S91_05635 [Treponema sp.]|nr:hypothetical protein [Treponema sp.]
MRGTRLLAVIAAAMMMASCASGKRPAEDEYPSSIADVDAISLGTLTYQVKSFGKLKQHTLNRFFVAPRRNTVELWYRDGMNAEEVVLGQGARVAVIEAVNAFVQEWEAHELKDVKAKANNAYSSGYMDFSFGVVSAAHELEGIPFYMNCIFVDGQPYLVMRIPSKSVKNENGVYSPYTELYFSRTQAETLAERLEQGYLEQLVQDNTFVEQNSYE